MALKKKSRKIHRTAFDSLLSWGLAGILLTACASQKIVPTASPISTPTQKQPLETNTPTPTATPRPTMTIAPTSTFDKITELASNFDIPGVCLFTYFESGDQNWIGADCNLFREMIIAEKAPGNKFTIPYQEIDNEAPDYFSVRPLSWSSDNRYFYFTTRCCEYDDSSNSNGSLYQFDIEKETWNILVRAVYEPFYFFSHDGEQYVFLNHYLSESTGLPEHLEIGMVNIRLNENKRVVFRNIWGPIYDKPMYAWSEDGDKFAIILDRLTSLGEHTIESEDILLKISFTKMDMELVEEFDRDNLLEEK